MEKLREIQEWREGEREEESEEGREREKGRDGGREEMQRKVDQVLIIWS